MKKSDAAYLAGLFDGEGCITYKQKMRQRRPVEKAYPTWEIRMEINMTHQSVIRLIHEMTGVGTVAKKPPGKGQLGKKMQWRWRCGYRDAYYVCRNIAPHSHVKLDKVQKIIDHYSDKKMMNGKVVSIKEYRKVMNLE
jgi:DUF917 family protein